MDPSITMLAGLFLVGLVAGFVDAIAGGGGVLTLPALMLSGLDPLHALATNKAQGVFGTATSLHRFANSPLLDRPRARRSFLPALAASVAGVLVITKVPQQILTPVVMALLLAVAVFMLVHRPTQSANPSTRHRSLATIALVAAALAFYDGAFGPGTGTLLIILYAWLWRDPLDAASANAKVVNFASNLGAMLTFASQSLIVWPRAFPMALGQIVGGYLGAHLTIRIGQTLVRYAVLTASLLIILRLAWKFTHPEP